MTKSANVRKRDKDRLWFVRLHHGDEGDRIAVGLFWAPTDEDARKEARKRYPALFKRLELPGWALECQETQPGLWRNQTEIETRAQSE